MPRKRRKPRTLMVVEEHYCPRCNDLSLLWVHKRKQLLSKGYYIMSVYCDRCGLTIRTSTDGADLSMIGGGP